MPKISGGSVVVPPAPSGGLAGAAVPRSDAGVGTTLGAKTHGNVGAPVSPVVPAAPRGGRPGWYRWVAAAAILMVIAAIFWGIRGRGPGRPDGTESEPRVTPIAFTPQVQQAIRDLPELQRQLGASGKGPGTPVPLEMVEQTTRADGSRVLHVWAKNQKPGRDGRIQEESVLMEVWIDAEGQPVQARPIGHKDADLAEMEKALDKM
ncbi:MAG: hypothetical protein WCI73_04220 [Phycisphaerae bacterium]